MRVEILCTGDEILSGKTVNTNYSYMARRLSEVGLVVSSGTTVGDDREALVSAILEAAGRADAVVVNGGLGPTIDDLSQEVAAVAAGVPLELESGWLKKVEAYYSGRGRVMPPANRKQAMLPVGSKILDNPIGTACGFQLLIGGAQFFFTPGVPPEMRKMLDEQVIPRLKTLSGVETVSRVKRFHSFGIGESRADELLQGIQGIAPCGEVKLGFQSHYPQLETKLTVHADSVGALERKLESVETEVRRRLGYFVVAEDDQTLEGRILDALQLDGASVATMEMLTGGGISSRLLVAPSSGMSLRRGIVSRDLEQLADAAGLAGAVTLGSPDCQTAVALAAALRSLCGSTHTLVTLVSLDSTSAKPEGRGDIYIGIVDQAGSVSRKITLLGWDWWIRLGAIELGLDSLRRHLYGAPVDQRIDFEIR
jgi:nicotinamide-nucleotide amidase